MLICGRVVINRAAASSDDTTLGGWVGVGCGPRFGCCGYGGGSRNGIAGQSSLRLIGGPHIPVVSCRALYGGGSTLVRSIGNDRWELLSTRIGGIGGLAGNNSSSYSSSVGAVS